MESWQWSRRRSHRIRCVARHTPRHATPRHATPRHATPALFLRHLPPPLELRRIELAIVTQADFGGGAVYVSDNSTIEASGSVRAPRLLHPLSITLCNTYTPRGLGRLGRKQSRLCAYQCTAGVLEEHGCRWAAKLQGERGCHPGRRCCHHIGRALHIYFQLCSCGR